MFYVYEHWRMDTNSPFYVGKGRKGRAFIMSRRNKHHLAIQEKVKILGFKVEVRIVSNSMNEADAFLLEVETIKKYRFAGIDLANKTAGGEGVAGLSFSDEHRRKLGDANRGKFGRKHTAEAIEKISIAAKIRFLDKNNHPATGRLISDETRIKMSNSRIKHSGPNKGKKKSEDIKKKISSSVSLAITGASNPFYGKKHSEDTKIKISESQKKRIAENGAWRPTDAQRKAKSESAKEWHRKKREGITHAA